MYRICLCLYTRLYFIVFPVKYPNFQISPQPLVCISCIIVFTFCKLFGFFTAKILHIAVERGDSASSGNWHGELFKRGAAEDNVPPSLGHLRHHARRSSYHAAIWLHCLELCAPHSSSQLSVGLCVLNSGYLAVVWRTQPVAPSKFLRLA